MIIDQRANVSQKVFCMMHTVDLAVKHALGISVRRKNKVVLDECLHLKRIRTRVKEFCSYIMDKHKKSRFEELKKISTDNWKCDCCKFEIPNVTRVAGFYRMLQSLIRNKHLIDLALTYQSEQLHELQEFALTDAEWIGVVQIECILQKMTALSMNMQSDIPGRQGLALYEIILTKEALFNADNNYDVIDITKRWRPDVRYDQLPRNKVNEKEFCNVASTLLAKLKKEFEYYLTELDLDMKVMTMVHPVAAGLGIGYVLINVIYWFFLY
jgi:hypothetical protein